MLLFSFAVLLNIVNNTLHVQPCNGIPTLQAHKVANLLLVIHKKVLGKNSSALGMLKDIETSLNICIPIRVVSSQTLANQHIFGCIIQAVCQLISLCLPLTCVTAPALRLHPLPITSSINVYANQQYIGCSQLITYSISTLASLLQGNILLLGNNALRIVTKSLKLLYYISSYLTCKLVFTENPIG